MASVRLDIEYDGTGFSGWSAQPGLRTVQGELESALAKILRERVKLKVAGRTDAGVHAWGQVASFETEADLPADLARRLNGVGSDQVTVTAATFPEAEFDARRDAKSRTYCYRVLARATPSPFERRRALWWPQRLDRGALKACSGALPGTHDFTAFTPTQTDHVRFERDILDAGWSAAGDVLLFRVTADAFMRNMVRVLIGTMLEVGCGRRSYEDFSRLLSGAPRSAAGQTAPPHGLYLESVSYG